MGFRRAFTLGFCQITDQVNEPVGRFCTPAHWVAPIRQDTAFPHPVATPPGRPYADAYVYRSAWCFGCWLAPKRSAEYLFEIIMRRYETRSTMMTSNRPLEDWGKLLGDVPSATAILDRFLHHADIIQITGKSYRLRNQGRSPRVQDEEGKPNGAPLPAVKSKPAIPEGGASDAK
jgi:hypothetical protein